MSVRPSVKGVVARPFADASFELRRYEHLNAASCRRVDQVQLLSSAHDRNDEVNTLEGKNKAIQVIIVDRHDLDFERCIFGAGLIQLVTFRSATIEFTHIS